MKHDKVCAHVYYLICKTFGIETADILCTQTNTHREKLVCQLLLRCVSIMELRVHTNRENRKMENRLDTLIKNKKEKRCQLIDVTIPADRNVTQKEAE
jgi:hypothetical protein